MKDKSFKQRFVAFAIGATAILLCKTSPNSARKESFREAKAMVIKMNSMTRRELEIKDESEIREILDRAKVVHVGMVDGDEPYVVPMNYGYTLEDGKLSLYLHGAPRGRKIDVIRANGRVFVSMECDLEPFSGDVACRYGLAYRSIMGRGEAVIVDDSAEKMRALEILMKTQTGRDGFAFDEKLAKIVSVIRIDIDEYTAKKRPPAGSNNG